MINEADFIYKENNELPVVNEGIFTWSSPSNIALVKYWGKKDNQIPANPSLSFTLSNCKTITTLKFERNTTGELTFDFFFEGKPKEDFKPKLKKFFSRIAPYCSYLQDYHFVIDSQNTFPHSSGIASSASGMAALAMNIMSLERLLQPSITDEYFDKKASFLARLGSGSASRSINGEVVVWGVHNEIKGSSDLYAVSVDFEIHPIFEKYHDVILLVDKGEKKVSSTLGHDLMIGHPFAQKRFEQAHTNLSKLKSILQNGDVNGFVALVESEALTLHAMMMTSMPYFILMKPNTLEIIERIWKFRSTHNIPVCFTLDAGANVHVLFPDNVKEEVMIFIENELAIFCQNNHYIKDEIGKGSLLIK